MWLDCLTSLGPCNPITDCTRFLCWNGKCANSIGECDPIPFCDIGFKRCSNGSCVSENIICPQIVCTTGEQLCVDGNCRTTCPKYFGCPVDQVMCGDGTCAPTYAYCNRNCTSPLVQCSNGCDTSCTLPDWSYYVFTQFQANNFYSDIGQFLATGPYAEKSDAIGLYFNFLVNSTQTYSVRLESLTPEQLSYIGPHPYWRKAFDTAALTGAWMLTYNTTAPQTELTFDFTVGISSPESLSLRNDTNHVYQYYCMAAPHLWYWDPQDLAEGSTLKGVPYIDQFRTIAKPYYSGGELYIPPEAANITTPPLRWKCLTDSQFGWPVTVGITQEQALRFGIHITVQQGTYALLWLPSKVVPPDAVLPNEPVTNFAVMGVAAVVLFVLLLIVGYKILVPQK